MRILMLSWEYPPHIVGGLGKHVADLVPALSACGVEVHLVTPKLRGGAEQERIAPRATIYRVPTPDMSYDGNGFATFAQMSNTNLEAQVKQIHATVGGFDLVHGHDWLVAYSSVALKHDLQLPLVATIHATERGRGQGHLGSEVGQVINGTERWLAHEAGCVIATSNFMAHQVQAYFDLPSEQVAVINNGINLPHDPPVAGAERNEFRRSFAGDDEQIVFYVGRVVYEKGIQVLIEAAPRILERRPQTRFVVAGTGPYLDQLKHQAWATDVAHAFVFTGFISDQDRDRLYQVADVAVFPSLYEPFGIVALEAMVFRCPVVVSATGGLQEVVRVHETGMTAHPGDPFSLAWAILETLEHPDWAQARAENALREATTLYNWEQIAAQTVAVYERVHAAAQRKR